MRYNKKMKQVFTYSRVSCKPSFTIFSLITSVITSDCYRTMSTVPEGLVLFFCHIYRYIDPQCTISSCYRTVPSATWEIFSEFLIFCNLFHEPLGE